ncbi:MAG TPA: ABC transporter ATP-binding protein [Candidatus Sumerlaeota bacterium]|nr:ABC transporter ATP-binding protein [Candidatus Sumerlaeota bacterium]HNM46092.1 ABC transporter ATP-binding protein [Candidatus Sumerlaeota bacterium]
MFVELQNLSVDFGKRRILNNISTAFTGKSVGLLGPNGAGKSTLIKSLLGFVKPAEGTARIMGFDVRREAMKIRQLVGYMPEHEAYIGDMSAVRLLRYLGELAGLPPGAAMERAHEVLYYVGIGELRYRPVRTYSLGNQQRVKLAQALVHGPKVLILDEPTNSLDPEGREEMRRLVRDIGLISNSHVIMCSHILQDVEFCCNSVVVINRGCVVLNGVIAELKKEDLRTYDIRIEGDRERLIGAMAARGWPCAENEKGEIRVQLPEGEGTRSIFEMARDIGVQLRHFHFKKDSLEDIFMSALQESERGTANARS